MAKLQNYSRAQDRIAGTDAIYDQKNPFSATRLQHFVFNHLGAMFIWCLVLLLGACSKPLASEPDLIVALQQMQELATVEYTVSKVVKANDNKDWYKWGDRKILFTCQASIKAGINLSQITNEDISIDGKQIKMRLPLPKILSVNMPPENIRMAYSEVDIFRSDFTSQEKNSLLVQAEKQIWAVAAQTGILEQAKLNTQTFMLQWLRQMGFEQIELSFDKTADFEQKAG
jgi:hypothetical protein